MKGKSAKLTIVQIMTRVKKNDPYNIPDQVSVPVGNVLVGHSGGHIEHDDRALALQSERVDINAQQRNPLQLRELTWM